MRALRARLGNVPNEITIYTYTTTTTKRLFSGHFVAFVEIVDFVGFGGYRGIVISLKPLLSWFSGGIVKPLKSLIPLGSLRLRDTLLGATKKTGAFQHPSLGRSSGI